MTLLATRSNKLSGVLAFETFPEYGVCREDVTVVVESGMDIGAVVARTLISGSATVTAGSNTGNGTVGTVTVGKFAQVGTYRIVFTGTAVNAGGYRVTNPQGLQVGNASVGAVCTTSDGISFTIADGSTDFAVGDSFTVAVTGTVKYEWVEAADVATLAADVGVVIDSKDEITGLTAGDHTLTILTRGHAGVVGASLQYKDSLTTNQKAVVLAALKAKNIHNRTRV